MKETRKVRKAKTSVYALVSKGDTVYICSSRLVLAYDESEGELPERRDEERL